MARAKTEVKPRLETQDRLDAAIDPIERLREANWEGIQLELLKYALYRVNRLRWKTQGAYLPKGISAEDLVVQAIQKTFEGAHRASKGESESATGARFWDPGKNPDLVHFLKGVIDSDVNHLVNSEEHRKTEYKEDPVGVESIPDHQANPEELFIKKSEGEGEDGFDAFFERMLEDFKDDREVQLVLRSYREQAEGEGAVKPATVAKETGLGIEAIRNAIKRLKRRVLAGNSGRGPDKGDNRGELEPVLRFS